MDRKPWREILVDVEAANRNFRVAVDEGTTVKNVLDVLTRQCQEEGLPVSDWMTQRVGVGRAALVLLRKSQGAIALPPTTEFGQLAPNLAEEERFSLDARAVVG